MDCSLLNLYLFAAHSYSSYEEKNPNKPATGKGKDMESI